MGTSGLNRCCFWRVKEQADGERARVSPGCLEARVLQLQTPVAAAASRKHTARTAGKEGSLCVCCLTPSWFRVGTTHPFVLHVREDAQWESPEDCLILWDG